MMTPKCMSDLPAQMPGRAELERCACTRTNLLIVAPPGLGATMIATRAAGILPGEGRPLRAPHFTVSVAGMTGTPARSYHGPKGESGERPARMGELAYAHGGVLFLDQVQEFYGAVIGAIADVLRRGTCYGYAAKPVMVIASATPCPCGYLGTGRACVCSTRAIEAHMGRVSSCARQLKLDTVVRTDAVTLAGLRGAPRGETSEAIRARVTAAWEAEQEEAAAHV